MITEKDGQIVYTAHNGEFQFTVEEMLKALDIAAYGSPNKCDKCPYHPIQLKTFGCSKCGDLMMDAKNMIEYLLKERGK